MSSCSSAGALIGGHFQLKLLTIIYANQFKSNVDFLGEGKTRVPGEKPPHAEWRTWSNKLNPHMMPSLEIEPRPHQSEVSNQIMKSKIRELHIVYYNIIS